MPLVQWFVTYGQRRFKENRCGDLEPTAAEVTAVAQPAGATALAGTGALAAAGALLALARRRRHVGWAAGEAPLLA